MKQSFELESHINPKIKVGDTVRVWDGSGITSIKKNGLQEIIIVFSYEKLTGRPEKIKEIDAVVLETNVKNHYCTSPHESAYRQDLIIQIGKEKFRTPSKFVRKV